MSFMISFIKVAVCEMARESHTEATAPMEAAVPGSSLRADAETGQRRKRNYVTDRVLNEKKEFKPSLHHEWKNSREPVIT